MTTAQVVATSVTNNSLSKDYLHLDDHARQTITLVFGIASLPLGNSCNALFGNVLLPINLKI